MLGKQPFEDLYEQLLVQPSAAYRALTGEPVHLNATAFAELITRLKNFREVYPNMAFWLVIDYKSLTITYSEGDQNVFGFKLTTLKDFFRQIHPDYVLPYLHWRAAAYSLIHSQYVELDPLEAVYRQTIPLKARDNQFYWFSMNSSVVQVDAQRRIATNLQTFYREGKWSTRNLRPFEAGVQIKNFSDSLEHQLIAQVSLQLIEAFTNAELDLLSLYASGKTAEEIMQTKAWSRNTLHEYNANLLKKAKAIFVYDFRNARDFAGYCLEKGFIHIR